MKYIIKISQPTEWQNKINITSPREEGIWGDFQFIITKEKIECDYWIVLGDLPETEEAICPEENVIYITDEAHSEKRYDQSFLYQFAAIITAREDIFHNKLIVAPYMCAWFLIKNFDFLKSLKPDSISKSKTLSAVCSNLTILEGQKKRFAFINQMMGHFKNRFDVYGRGFNEVDDKFDALINYQYSIAIENSHLPRYFSEKIADCFLTYTMPIYYGCSNILDYFPEDAIILIDIKDFEGGIDKIEEAIMSSRYKKNLGSLIEARNIYFEKYHQLQAITKILEERFDNQNNKKNIQLKSMKSYLEIQNTNAGIFKKYRNYVKRYL
jgi:hypothetical protein